MVEIIIFNETRFKRPPKKVVKDIVGLVLRDNKISSGACNVVYLDDKAIKEINRKYLQHSCSTDVISFRLDDEQELLGEIYISLETAERQSKVYNVSITNEIKRLAIHGALHLVGFDDASSSGKEEMTNLENYYLKN